MRTRSSERMPFVEEACIVVQGLDGPCMTFLLRVLLALGFGLATAALL